MSEKDIQSKTIAYNTKVVSSMRVCDFALESMPKGISAQKTFYLDKPYKTVAKMFGTDNLEHGQLANYAGRQI